MSKDHRRFGKPARLCPQHHGAGCQGHVSKTTPPEHIVKAINGVMPRKNE